MPAREQKRLFENVLIQQNGIRNHAILRLMYGYPLRAIEAIKLKTFDLVSDEGVVKELSETNTLRASVSFSNTERPFPLSCKKIIEAVQRWIDYRIENGIGAKGGFLIMDTPLFLKNNSEGFSDKKTEGFTRMIREVHDRNGINGNIETPLRTWTLIQHEKGVALKVLWVLRGDKSIATVRNLVKAHPVKYSKLVESII